MVRLEEGERFLESYVVIDERTRFLAVSQYVLDSMTVDDMNGLTKHLAEANRMCPRSIKSAF